MRKSELKLGVNIDHVATVRQARGTLYPDPVYAALEAEHAGADLITLHLREDRRHIQPRDVKLLINLLQTRMNLEMAVTNKMLDFALEIKPAQVCLVPEKREELTTEGGLDVISHSKIVSGAIKTMQAHAISVCLFIDPEPAQIEAAVSLGADSVELHTGAYADCMDAHKQQHELERLQKSAFFAHEKGIVVNAGHGLHYHNVKPVAQIPYFHELNIGHAIIAQAIFSGLKQAICQMKALMLEARLA